MKKEKKIKFINKLFLFIFCFATCIFVINIIMNKNDNNFYENRKAYQAPIFNFKSFNNKDYQNNLELFFSDQIPFSTEMKKSYNFIHNMVINGNAKSLLNNKSVDRYIDLGPMSIYGKEKYLLYSHLPLKIKQEGLDKRIKNINEVINKSDAQVYLYYVEKDNDMNFETNKKEDYYNYLKDRINTNNIYKFAINSFDEYKEYFYKTDHHWNNRGSYKAYQELVNILTDDKPIKYEKEILLSNISSGTKARYIGAKNFYKENFYVYTFNLPKYDIYINKEKQEDYGNLNYYINNLNKCIRYRDIYGHDEAEVIIDNQSPNKENILLVGDSYDNALLKLLASHFNKLYAIDLRHYEQEYGEKFNYYKYLKDNSIDKVLLIGCINYFTNYDTFNLE